MMKIIVLVVLTFALAFADRATTKAPDPEDLS